MGFPGGGLATVDGEQRGGGREDAEGEDAPDRVGAPPVPQGALERPGGGRSRRKNEEVRPEKGVENLFIGAAFLLVTILGALFFRRGFMIWIWFIIPGLSLVGSGVATLMRAKREAQREAFYNPASAFPTMPTPRSRFDELPAPSTSEIGPPASVTESTTRHLNKKEATQSQRSSADG